MKAKVSEVFYKQRGIRKKSILFRDFAVVYLEKFAQEKKRSWKTDEKFLNAQLIPFFGKMRISEITSEDVSDFVIKRSFRFFL